MINLEEIRSYHRENGKIRFMYAASWKNLPYSTAGLEALLGDNIASREMTPEF